MFFGLELEGLQIYWWVILSLLGGLLVFMFFVQGGQTLIDELSSDELEKTMHTLADKCIDGISANEKICSDFVYNSVGIVTALNPYIGYENSASIAKEAMSTGKRVADIALERGLLSKEQIDEILTPANMLNPHMEAKK